MNIQEELVNKAINGNDEAFVELVNICKFNLYRMAFVYLKNEQASLDAVSETIYKAYMNIHKLKKEKFFNTWITKILINLCINNLKKDKKIIYIDDYTPIDKSDILQMDLQISEKIDLNSAIDTLDMKYKNLIILKYFKDMTIYEISKLLQWPEGTVKVYLKRGLEKLKIQLQEEWN